MGRIDSPEEEGEEEEEETPAGRVEEKLSESRGHPVGVREREYSSVHYLPWAPSGSSTWLE